MNPVLTFRISKMRESCLAEFDAHWQCLEKNNQVGQGWDEDAEAVLSSVSKTRDGIEPMRFHQTCEFDSLH